MQQTLTFTENKKKYVSKPFDFEAMCIINDATSDNDTKGVLRLCKDALDYMFEGTEATQDIIEKMSIRTRARLCMDLWKMYVDALTEKNE